MHKKAFQLIVDNTSGVLSRISGLFSRRGYNIESITAGVTADPRFTRITIVASGDDEILDQIVGPVLASCLVAVLHTDLEHLSVLGRDPLQYLAEIVVKVCAYVLLAHLVRLKSGSLHSRACR